MGDRAFANRCCNNGFSNRWTCPGCYSDLSATRPGTVTCDRCGRTVRLSVDYEPVSVAELVEEDAE